VCSHPPHRPRAGGACGSHALQIPLLLALPYVLRFVQCLIVFSTMHDTPQLFNAVKYTTALPVVFLSWVKYYIPLAHWYTFWKPLWISAAVVNTSYSFYWDVERDWDIRLFHRSAHLPAATCACVNSGPQTEQLQASLIYPCACKGCNIAAFASLSVREKARREMVCPHAH
jgi:EXS family